MESDFGQGTGGPSQAPEREGDAEKPILGTRPDIADADVAEAEDRQAEEPQEKAEAYIVKRVVTGSYLTRRVGGMLLVSDDEMWKGRFFWAGGLDNAHVFESRQEAEAWIAKFALPYTTRAEEFERRKEMTQKRLVNGEETSDRDIIGSCMAILHESEIVSETIRLIDARSKEPWAT